MKSFDFDIVVIGAGSSGAAAAYHLARRGLQVALVDKLPFETAGARWVNSIADRLFPLAGLEAPHPPELHDSAAPSWMIDKSGRRRFRIDPPQISFIDMRFWVKHLQALAVHAGAVPFEAVRFEDVSFKGERPVSAVFRIGEHAEGGSGPGMILNARLFVDATGIAGTLRNAVPALARNCPRLRKVDLCTAAQSVHGIRDRNGARRYLESMHADSDEVLAFFGVSGGFSIFTVLVKQDKEEVDLLGGAIADGSHRSGEGLVGDFLAKESWIGARKFGGHGLIPLRRPFDRLGSPGVVLVGDAGCHVFPAHGSGVGIGMAAGRILAETAGAHSDPGSLEAVWEYQAAFMRDTGAVSAAYDVMRRFSQTMPEEQVGLVPASGLLTVKMKEAGLTQVMRRPAISEYFEMAAAALRHPRLALRMARPVSRMFDVHNHYMQYPTEPDMGALSRWSARAASFFGDPPDIGSL